MGIVVRRAKIFIAKDCFSVIVVHMIRSQCLMIALILESVSLLSF